MQVTSEGATRRACGDTLPRRDMLGAEPGRSRRGPALVVSATGTDKIAASSMK